MDDKTYQFLLNEISEHHLKTIKSFSKPPQELVSLFEAVFLLIFNQVPVSWRHSQKFLANISKFMDDIYDLDVNNLSKEQEPLLCNFLKIISTVLANYCA